MPIFDWFRRDRTRKVSPEEARIVAARIREKYGLFQEILNLNTDCLELIAALQEDLQFIPPRRDVLQDRVTEVFDHAKRIVSTLEKLSGMPNPQLMQALEDQRFEVERHIAALQELSSPRLAASLSEITIEHVPEVGGKAAYLGEIKNRVRLPVPDGFVLTTEAYRQFCGIPHWRKIRDAIRTVDLDKLETLQSASGELRDLVLESPLPRSVEVALMERPRAIRKLARSGGFAVRSSAVGEGGEKSYAGQFLTLLNVTADQLVSAYRGVIAARFSERALSYRLTSGLFEVDAPLAVLVLSMVPAVAAGILYTRDPSSPKSKEMWVTSTRGLGIDIAGGQTPGDLFVVSRKGTHRIVRQQLAHKDSKVAGRAGGGIDRVAVAGDESDAPSLSADQLARLADYGLQLEKHFRAPQDIEWAVDENDEIWILQSRPLALVQSGRSRPKAKPHEEPIAEGGLTVFPGRVSGKAYAVSDPQSLLNTPEGAILLLHQTSPEIVQVFPRISGLVAEWGNVAGHAAALLREFKIPAVFMMKGILEKAPNGEDISLDAVQRKVYPGALWEGREIEMRESDQNFETAGDPISRNILALHLIDPAASSFRPSACKSTHDVLRYCHEKSVEAMFSANDYEMERAGQITREIECDVPLNLFVLDLGGGLHEIDPEARTVRPDQIASAPFRSLWKGVTHPGVSWRRDLPASMSDLVSVVAQSFTPGNYDMRSLGMKSYLLVADEYMNMNTRLAYHFSLVDACVSDDPLRNYVSFRFAGGGATRYRRSLRACFIDNCLSHYGFVVHRRGDLVNAWLRNAPAEEVDYSLDILGRLIACACQLDMYLSNPETMKWFVRQFIAGNYGFTLEDAE